MGCLLVYHIKRPAAAATGPFVILFFVWSFSAFFCKKAGCIINISSTGALQGERNSSIYAATKAGIMALSRAAALELGPSGITINCVLPGFTRTNNNCHVPHTIDESFIPITPTGRVTVAQDIANACLFFAGEEAAQITAQCLPVDGGFSGTRAVQVAWNASMERK